KVTIHVGEKRAEHVFVSANPSTLPLTGGSSKITAVVTDTNGNPLKDIGVQFTTDQGTLTSGGKVLRTNVNGIVTDTLFTTVTATVTATTLSGATGTVTVTVGISTLTCGDVASQTDIA